MMKILVMLKDQCWVSKVIGMLLIRKILQIFRNMGILEKYGNHIISLLISTIKIFTLRKKSGIFLFIAAMKPKLFMLTLAILGTLLEL